MGMMTMMKVTKHHVASQLRTNILDYDDDDNDDLDDDIASSHPGRKSQIGMS